jgi:cadmium resistance protein CadD (predicted permease)
MRLLVETLLSGVFAFAATTVDDLLILALLFANQRFLPRHIIAGQFVAFALLIAGSLLGAFLSLVIPPHWIGLLGLLPLYMGLAHLLRRGEVHTLDEVERDEPAGLRSLLDVETYRVAAITLGNGGDNLGIYIPLFASVGLWRSLALSGLFLTLVGLLCLTGLQLARHPTVGKWLAPASRLLAPLVLIGLGVYILVSSGAWGWALAHLSSR